VDCRNAPREARGRARNGETASDKPPARQCVIEESTGEGPAAQREETRRGSLFLPRRGQRKGGRALRIPDWRPF